MRDAPILFANGIAPRLELHVRVVPRLLVGLATLHADYLPRPEDEALEDGLDSIVL